MSKVSVIIPTFNRAGPVCRAVESALAQKGLDRGVEFEIVVVDDGSSDGTREVIAKRFGSEPRVRYHAQTNQGVSSARNRAIRESTGELLAFLDSDDVWMPGKLALELRALARFPSAGMVWTDMQAVDPDGQVLHSRYLRKMYRAYRWMKNSDSLFGEPATIETEEGRVPVHSGDLYSQMVLGNLVHTSTVLLKRTRLPAPVAPGVWFREDYLRGGEDYEFHLRVCREGPVTFVDAVTTRYQVGHPDALTKPYNQIELAERFLTSFKHALNVDRARIQLPDSAIRECLIDAEAWLGRELLMAGRPRESLSHLRRSLQIAPRQWSLYKFVAAALLPETLRDPLIRRARGGKS